MTTARIVIYHSSYGCDTGCCGHTIEMGDEQHFQFDHPYGQDDLTWAKELVREVYGNEHVADLDWDECLVVDD